jgi:hypothetical protein
MNTLLFTTVGLALFGLICAAGLVLHRDLKRGERFALRVNVIHSQASAIGSAEPEIIRETLTRHAGRVGQAILSSGLVPARTRSEIEQSLASSGQRGTQGVGVFVAAKLALMTVSRLTVDWDTS